MSDEDTKKVTVSFKEDYINDLEKARRLVDNEEDYEDLTYLVTEAVKRMTGTGRGDLEEFDQAVTAYLEARDVGDVEEQKKIEEYLINTFPDTQIREYLEE